MSSSSNGKKRLNVIPKKNTVNSDMRTLTLAMNYRKSSKEERKFSLIFQRQQQAGKTGKEQTQR